MADTPPTDPDDERRLIVTLGVDSGAATRRMARELGVSTAEAVRRGLTLLDVQLSLDVDEELVIRNRDTGECDRLRFHWDWGGP